MREICSFQLILIYCNWINMSVLVSESDSRTSSLKEVSLQLQFTVNLKGMQNVKKKN